MQQTCDSINVGPVPWHIDLEFESMRFETPYTNEGHSLTFFVVSLLAHTTQKPSIDQKRQFHNFEIPIIQIHDMFNSKLA
mmetsp:Transcript_9198/g.33963  ORF Transcript_9198/g.33963 Transcript_9198/m.33963 type:complete len:80 (+) Transcript_9198:5510-5749(+)